MGNVKGVGLFFMANAWCISVKNDNCNNSFAVEFIIPKNGKEHALGIVETLEIVPFH